MASSQMAMILWHPTLQHLYFLFSVLEIGFVVQPHFFFKLAMIDIQSELGWSKGICCMTHHQEKTSPDKEFV